MGFVLVRGTSLELLQENSGVVIRVNEFWLQINEFTLKSLQSAHNPLI